MRQIRIVMVSALGALTIALGGCADLLRPADVPVSQSLPVAAQSVQKTINEVNIALTAAANVVAQNKADGIYNDAEVAGYKAQLQDAARQVDKAQNLLRLGDIASARTQAEIVERLILALHKEVVARSRRTQ